MAGGRSYGFGLGTFKKFPELIPLVGFISSACLAACTFMVYSLATKPDVRLVKSRGPAFEDVGPTDRKKFYDFDRTKYKPIPELEKLKKEIGSYKS